MRKRSELFFSLILIPIDFLAMLVAFVAAYAIRVKIDPRPVAHPLGIAFFLKIFLLVVPVVIFIFAISGLYNLSSHRGRLQEVGKIFVAVSGGLMFMIALDFVSTKPVFSSKSIPVYAYGLSLITVTLGRQVMRLIQRTLFRFNVGVHRTVVVGSGPIAQRIVEDIKDTGHSGFRVIGVLDSARGAQKRMSPIRVDNNLTNLINRHGKNNVDEIIQADSSLGQEEILSLMSFAATNHIAYKFVPNQLGIFAAHSDISTLAGMPIVTIRRTPLEGWGRIVKRLFDLVAATLGLIVLSPLFLVVSLLIMLMDPGPIFYRHKRFSRAGQYVSIMKFRTMKAQYSTGHGFSGKTDAEIFAELGKPELAEEFAKEQKLKNDPRVSSIGRLLRRTSLDELPQLVNIVKGDISLVGPRPIVDAELERYGVEQSKLFSLRPGLTGLWQISGRSDIGYEERVKLDIYYVENWSLWLDIKIILRTFTIVFGRNGAY